MCTAVVQADVDTHTHTRTCVRARTHTHTPLHDVVYRPAVQFSNTVNSGCPGPTPSKVAEHMASRLPESTRGWGPTSLSSQSRGPAGAESFTCVCVRTPCVTDTAGADTGHAAVSTEWTRPSARPGPASALQPALLGGHNGDLGCTHTVVMCKWPESTQEWRAGAMRVSKRASPPT